MLRGDLDPTAIPRLLRHLILAEVGDGGRAIRYRLVGTEIVEAHGFDYTGLTVEELTSGATLDYTRELYGILASRAVPVYSEGRFRWADKEYRWTKRLHLPLSSAGTGVDMVLSGQVFEEWQPHGCELMVAALPGELEADRLAVAAANGTGPALGQPGV